MGKKKVWVPPPKPPRERFGTCRDCGVLVWKMQGIWQMLDGWVCLSCADEYSEAGNGFMDAAGFELPAVMLEGF